MAPRYTSIVLGLTLVVLVAVVLGPALDNPFLFYEDWQFVTRNSVVQAGLTWSGVQWAFSTYLTGNWYPLTWLTHMADTELYGLHPWGHHLTNLVLHAANTLLLFWFLSCTTGCRGRSAWVASLFAIHPLHVESVAWVSERKDVLSTFFWLLTMLAYCRYVRLKSCGAYLGVVVIFTLGLMSKPMLVTLPCVLLLLDFWPLRRFDKSGFSLRWVIVEKVPLFLLSGVFSVITVIAQRSADAVAGLDITPLGTRVANSIVAYATYLRKTALPSDLAIFYPYPTPLELSLWRVGGELTLLFVLTAIAVRDVRSRPYLAFGWFWYLGTLVPVIGLVQVGSQAYADRYTYVPLIGIFIAVVWAIGYWAASSRVVKKISVSLGVGCLLFLAIGTRQQIRLWRDDVSLFRHAIAVTRDNYMAENLLGLGYIGQGRRDEARLCFERSVMLEPHFADAHNNLGMVLLEMQQLQAARESFGRAIRANPKMAKAYLNLAGVFFQERNYEGAVTNYLEAVRIDPDYATAYRNLGITYRELGRYEDAKRSFERALRLSPGDVTSKRNIEELDSNL